MSRALLFAVAGTSDPEAAAAFRNIDRLAKARFPDVPRHWTYTSGGVRRKLAARGALVDEPAAALARLRKQGVTRLAVLSLHMVAGMEYGELRETVEGCNAAGDFEQCVLGKPILETPGLFPGIVRELLREVLLPPVDDAALLLVAHGSRSANTRQAYEDASTCCRNLETPVLFGTLTAPLESPSVVKECGKRNLRRVFLLPFTIAAGTSATGEIAGPGPASWKSLLEREKIACVPVLRGLGDYDAVARLWVEEAGKLLESVS